MPCKGWNSAAVGALAVRGIAPAGLPFPLAVSVGPTVPCPPEHAPRSSAAAKHAAITNLSIFPRAPCRTAAGREPIRAVLVVVVEEPQVGYALREKGGKPP